nr:hypothetical protein [Sphingomonas sp. Ant20]
MLIAQVQAGLVAEQVERAAADIDVVNDLFEPAPRDVLGYDVRPCLRARKTFTQQVERHAGGVCDWRTARCGLHQRGCRAHDLPRSVPRDVHRIDEPLGVDVLSGIANIDPTDVAAGFIVETTTTNIEIAADAGDGTILLVGREARQVSQIERRTRDLEPLDAERRQLRAR